MQKLTRRKDGANSSFYSIFGSVAGQCRGGFFPHYFFPPPRNAQQRQPMPRAAQMPTNAIFIHLNT